ncbi:MAG: hypothetical protein IT377_02975 [Polyangiaceae bacterium]|nr:hypothetical protein [Polyangiaceae bacterium]
MRATRARFSWFCLVWPLACAARPPPDPEPVSAARAAPAPTPAPESPAPESPSPLAVTLPAACSDDLAGEPARVSCDASRFELAHPIVLHPDRPAPDEPTRGVLDRVGQLMAEHPEILLLRIEVGVGEDPGPDPAERRAALASAQRRADALLQYLWRRRGVSAERLEAVAYEHDPKRVLGRERFPVLLRIVQRAPR